MTNTHIAKLMWDAYAIQAGGKTFDGKPLPTWDKLGDDRQSCWVAAASVTADRIEKLEAALRRCDELFSDIRNDWSDPRSECREGWSVVKEALEGKDD